jgi:hypothetical protein
MSARETKDAPAPADHTAETAATYTAQSATPPGEAIKRVADLTVAELRELIRQVVREEQRPAVDVDDEGYLVFRDEAAYAAYLGAHPDKYPSELCAYYIDPHGLKVHYSDYELTPEKARELEEIRREPTIDGETVFRELGL